MFDASLWKLVDPLKLEQAACLWAGVDPESPWRLLPEKTRVGPYLQLLSEGFRTGEFPADELNIWELIGTYDKSNVTCQHLRMFAERKNLRPAFLFDDAPSSDAERSPASTAPRRGHAAADAPLLDEMEHIIATEHISNEAAAKRVASKAKGASDDARIRRLTRKMKKRLSATLHSSP